MKRGLYQCRFVLLTVVTCLLCWIMPTVAQSATPADLIRQGEAAYNQGQFEQAIATWKRAEHAYQDDAEGVAGSRINQSQALMAMGRQRHACKLLVETLYRNPDADRLCDFANRETPDLQTNPLPAPLVVMGVDKLAEALRQVGNLEEAETLLRQHWSQTSIAAQPALLLNLGNTLRDLGNRDRDRIEQLNLTAIKPGHCLDVTTSNATADSFYNRAIACYQAAAASDLSTAVRLQANLNYLSLLADLQQWVDRNSPKAKSTEFISRFPQIETLIGSIQSQLQTFPSQVERFFIQLNFAHTLILIRNVQNGQLNQIEPLIHQAIMDATSWKNQRLSILAMGELGWFYEQTNRLLEALKQTELALKLTRSIEVDRLHPQDLTYQWEWQRGRILRRLGQNQAAIVAYENAINALKTVREQVLGVNPDVQFSLRDTVEPIYREYVDLLLPSNKFVEQSALEKSVELIDDLQVAELENFFRCRLGNDKKKINQVPDPTAAIVYPIILPDRLEIVLKLPEGSTKQKDLQQKQLNLTRYSIPVSRTDFVKTVQKLRLNLAQSDSGRETYEIPSTQLYQWLIYPLRSALPDQIETLVFVPDGILRTIPIAVLWDQQAKQFLIQQYAIAVTPGLKLLNSRKSPEQPLEGLLAGLSDGVTVPNLRGISVPFDPLPYVLEEIQSIKGILPKTVTLLSQKFNPTDLEQQLKFSSYPIVHLATHGKFDSDPALTFIVTASGDVINFYQLQNMLQKAAEVRKGAIDLFVLSACETAAGDRRATLGMAGLAVRTGVSGTLASLWKVSDPSTAELMQQFYTNLVQSSSFSKVKALQIAQQALIQQREWRHPYYWSSFILVGNWL